jgi:hypothetical protein
MDQFFVSALQQIGNTCPWTQAEIDNAELVYSYDELLPDMTQDQIKTLLQKRAPTDARFKVVKPEKGYLTVSELLEYNLVQRVFPCELSFKKKWVDGYEMHPLSILFDVDHGHQIMELENKRPGILDQLELLYSKTKSDRRVQLILFLVLHEECDYLFLDPTSRWVWPQRPNGLSPEVQALQALAKQYVGEIQMLWMDTIHERFFKRALDLNGILPRELRDAPEMEQAKYLDSCYLVFVSKVSEIFNA